MIALRAALLFAALLFVPRLYESFETPKILAVRVLGLAALAGWLASAPWRRRPSSFEWALLGWLAIEALATALSVSPRTSLLGDAYQLEGLATSAALAGLALGARAALADERAFARTGAVALAAAALACAYALFQVAGFDPLPWSRTAGYGAGFVRPFGTLGHPNLLGVVSAAACAWAAALWLRRPHLRWLLGPAALLAALATLLTFSRAAWLGLAAGLAVVAAGTWLDRGARRPPLRTIAAAAAVVVAVAALFWLGGWSRLFSARAAELGQAGGETGASRVEIWTSALAMWRERPVLGQGPDTFEMVFPRVQTPGYWRIEWAGVPFHAHSVYLHTLATRGLAGALAGALLAAAVALAAARAWRAGGAARERAVLLAGGIAAIAVAGLAGAIGVNGALWLLVSAAALDTAAGTAAAGAPRPRAAIAVALATGLAAAWWCWRVLGASHDVAYAERARAADPAGALVAAEHALSLVPGDDRALGLLADARLALGAARRDAALVGAACEAAEAAIAAAPARAIHWQRLGAAHGTRALGGDAAAAAAMDSSFAHAERLAPYNVLPALEHARWWIVLGEPGRAIPLAREAVRLYPRESLPRTTLASALVASGRRDEARAELEAAMRGNWRPREADRGAAADVLAKLSRGAAPATSTATPVTPTAR